MQTMLKSADDQPDPDSAVSATRHAADDGEQASDKNKGNKKSKSRGWWAAVYSGVTVFVALVSVIIKIIGFSDSHTINQVKKNSTIALQISNAQTELDSSEESQQLQGVTNLRTVMQESKDTQQEVLSLLTRFIRTQLALPSTPAGWCTGDNTEAPQTTQASNLTDALKTALQVISTADAAGAGSEVDLHMVNLSDVDLSGFNFTGADLYNADLYRATGTGVRFRDADLKCALLGGVTLAQVDFEGAYLDRSNIGGATLTGIQLAGAYVAYANLGGTQIDGQTSPAALCSGTTPTLAQWGYSCEVLTVWPPASPSPS